MLCCAVLLDGPEVGWMEGRRDGRVRNRTVVGDTRHTTRSSEGGRRGRMLKFPKADGEESRTEQKQLTYWEKEEVGQCLRQAGKQDGRLFLAPPAADVLLPSTCACVYGCPQQRAAADQAQAQEHCTAPSHALLPT